MTAGILEHPPIEGRAVPRQHAVFKVVRPRAADRMDQTIRTALPVMVLAAAVPAGSNHPIAWAGWAVIIAVLGTLRWMQQPPDWRVRPNAERVMILMASMVVAFACFQALVARSSTAPNATLLAGVRIASLTLFFVLLRDSIHRNSQAEAASRMLFFGIAFHAFAALVMLRLLGDATPFTTNPAYQGIVTGTFVGKNAFATYLGMGLVLGIALGRRTRRVQISTQDTLGQVVHWCCLATLTVALIGTQSRLGIAATAIAAVPASGIRLSRRALLLGGLAAVASTMAVLSGPWLNEGLASVGRSIGIRLNLYGQVLQMIADRPFAGHGLDAFALAFEPYHGPPVTAAFVWDKAHSTYLGLWAEAGLIFGSLPILAGLIAFIQLRRRPRTVRRRSPMRRAAMAALVLAAIHSIADFSLEIEANMFLFLALIAIGLPRTEALRKDF